MSRLIQEHLRLPVTVLRYVSHREDRHARQSHSLFVLESHADGGEPAPEGRWMAHGDASAVSLADPAHRSILQAVLRERASGEVPALRPCWARPGWFAEAVAWIERELGALGHRLTQPVEQFSVKGYTCLLRAQTDTGAFYFKTASSYPTVYVHEAALMQELSALFPECVPAPVAVHLPNRWMLLPDLGKEVPKERWGEAMRMLGRLQIRSVARRDAWIGIKCTDQRLDRLENQVDALFGDPAVLAYLDDDTISRLHDVAPALKALCRKLAGFGLPDTLVHGDFHFGNMAVSDGSIRFLDWTDACISHPFVDLKNVFEQEPEVQSPLRECYLDGWRDHASLDDLREMWQIARPLCALHQAIRNQQIVAKLEPAAKPDMDFGIPSWMSRIVQWMPQT